MTILQTILYKVSWREHKTHKSILNRFNTQREFLVGVQKLKLSLELNGEVIWSGEEKNHMSGVGFLLSNRAKGALLGCIQVNSRIIAARFSGAPLDIAVIQVYAPTSDSSKEDIKTFYGQLEQTIEELPKKNVKIIIRDWNTKVGTHNVGWDQVMRPHGYGEHNDRGHRLLEFA